MIFVETSAIVAIMLNEPIRESLAATIAGADSCVTGSHVRLETCMVVASRTGLPAQEVNEEFDAFLRETQMSVLPFTDEIATAAVLAFDTYGKGRNSKTALNLAECMSYAFAKTRNLKILYTGIDFQGTDLKAA
jgi:ribonuclease VapC